MPARRPFRRISKTATLLMAASAVCTMPAVADGPLSPLDLGADAAAHNMEFSVGWHSPKQMKYTGLTTDQQADFVDSVASTFTAMQGMRINELLRTPEEYGNGSVENYNIFWLNRLIDELIIERGMEARLHALFYTPPPWMRDRQAGTVAEDWETLRVAMHRYATETVTYVNDRVEAATGEDPVIQWDVINETVTDSEYGQVVTLPTGDQATFFNRLWFRASKFAGPSGADDAPGPDHVKEVLRWTRNADANDVLIVNEALGPNRKIDKQDDFYNLIRWIKSAPDTPLDAVGLQFHIHMDEEDPDWQQLDEYLADLSALGVDIYITELDVKLPLALQDATAAEKEEAFLKQAELYREVTNLALRHPAVKQINIWGWTDEVTWKDRDEVIFFGKEEGYTPKPAAHYIRWALRNYPKATPRPDHLWKFDDFYDTNNRGFSYRTLEASRSGNVAVGSEPRAVGSGSLYLDGYSGLRLDGEDLDGREVEQIAAAFWFKADRLGGNRILLDLGGRENGLTIRLNDDQIQARIIGKTDGRVDPRTVEFGGIEMARWYHVVVSYADGDLTLQIDGADEHAAISSGDPIETIQLQKAGAIGESYERNGFNNGKFQFFEGHVDDVRLYMEEGLSLEDGKKLAAMRWVD